jgi:two-component system alkaline phosphatase synthesis response regulator PhoP
MAQRILVVDDDQQLARLVRAYLEQAGYRVETAADGAAALRAIRQDRPDLVLLDLMLPDRDGWEITRLLRADPQWQDLPIIMLTARVEDSDKILGLELGADDYITKPCNPREVLARVRTVLRRVQGPGPPVHLLEVGALRMDLDRHSVTLAGRPVDLTPTEFGLLRVLLAHPEQVFARFQLIEQGLGYNYNGLERTIDTHIKNLRRKIEPDPAHPAYIQAVLGVGYRLTDPVGAGHE